ncbi:MAG TPA: s-methyl-5-thioribose-1-phosphate isomerase [Fastidiosipila sp.]|nr:s-methyl-5-thioribose-1-phosphate isomerase [Fastidiosipila sp.]
MNNLQRYDEGLPELLRFDQIAWYEDDIVRILDRRVYPMTIRYEICKTPADVADAIKNMVTQSGGPLLGVQMGMVLAAKEAEKMPIADRLKHLTEAGNLLRYARPTMSEAYGDMVDKSLLAATAAIKEGRSLVEATFNAAIEEANRRYKKIKQAAVHLVNTFPDQGTVMTQCFAETIVGMMCLEIRKQKKDIRFICPETRPYLQGARLTASVISDLGFDVYVITDNMPAAIMQRENVDVFTSAADVITSDGHVINKVGTFQIALAAHYLGIPYYVSGEPSTVHLTPDSITIEERDSEDVLHCLNTRTAKYNVRAFYPAFDITPPKLVSGIVTASGIIQPGLEQ